MNSISSRVLLTSVLLSSVSVQAAVFNVSNVNELRSALVSAANNGEDNEIYLSSGTYRTSEDEAGGFVYNSFGNNSLILQDADLDTPNDVVLDGSGTDEVLVLLNEQRGGSFSVTGITLQNGTRGLRIANGNLELDNARVLNNTSSSNGAGLLFNDYSHDLNISNSLFQGNDAGRYSGGGANVRAVNLSINDTSFESNLASNGAGLYVRSTSNSSDGIKNSEFVSNVASSSGGGIASDSNYLQVLDSRFEQNHAALGAGFSGDGSIERSYFDRNVSEYQGAAVSSTGTVSNSYFIGNIATSESNIYKSTLHCSYCRVLNNLFDRNTVPYEVTFSSGNASTSNVFANNIFLDTTSELFYSGYSASKINLRNNFLDTSKIGLSADRVFRSGNIFNGTPGMDDSYNVLESSILIGAGHDDPQLFELPLLDYASNNRIAGESVDIGPLEFGSSATMPKITEFELDSGLQQNLEELSFSIEYSLSAGRELESLYFDDGSGEYTAISLNNDGLYTQVFVEPGEKKLKVKVVDNQGEESIKQMQMDISARSISSIILLTQDACGDEPESCGIDTESYYGAGYQAGLRVCTEDPGLCGVDTEEYIDQGKQRCIDDPLSCGIKAHFDYTQLPNTTSDGWKLLGTSEPITNMSQFSNVKVVWAQKNNTWYAYSSDSEVKRLLSEKQIQVLTSIPAFSGFWVTK